VEGLCLVDELGHDGLDEAKAVRGIWIVLGEGEERAWEMRRRGVWLVIAVAGSQRRQYGKRLCDVGKIKVYRRVTR
jgi:hypothetical protein